MNYKCPYTEASGYSLSIDWWTNLSREDLKGRNLYFAVLMGKWTLFFGLAVLSLLYLLVQFTTVGLEFTVVNTAIAIYPVLMVYWLCRGVREVDWCAYQYDLAYAETDEEYYQIVQRRRKKLYDQLRKLVNGVPPLKSYLRLLFSLLFVDPYRMISVMGALGVVIWINTVAGTNPLKLDQMRVYWIAFFLFMAWWLALCAHVCYLLYHLRLADYEMRRGKINVT